MGKKYDQSVVDAIDRLIPAEVRKSLSEHGWNELGVYEAVKQAIKESKKSKK